MSSHETLEQAKHWGEILTGVGRPRQRGLKALVRRRTANLHYLKDDGATPNSRLPLVHYHSPIALDPTFDPAAIIERVFASNQWRHSWRDSIYSYNHFHTRTHEVLGIAQGQVDVQFGGAHGKRLPLKSGDVVVIPAGVGHRRRKASGDLLVVGAYPDFGRYDEPRPREIDVAMARRAIASVKIPFTDPVYGKSGPLLAAWTNAS